MMMNENSVDKSRHILSSVLVDPAILRVIERSNDSQDDPDEQMMSPLDHLWYRQHVDVIEKRLSLLEQSKERFECRLCELESLNSLQQHNIDQYKNEDLEEDSETLDNEDSEEEEEQNIVDDYERKSTMSLPPMKPEERQPSRGAMHNDSEGACDELKRLKKQYHALVHRFELKEEENRIYQTKYHDSLKKCKSIQQAYDKDRLKFKEKEMHWQQHVRNLETELLLYHPVKAEKKRFSNQVTSQVPTQTQVPTTQTQTQQKQQQQHYQQQQQQHHQQYQHQQHQQSQQQRQQQHHHQQPQKYHHQQTHKPYKQYHYQQQQQQKQQYQQYKQHQPQLQYQSQHIQQKIQQLHQQQQQQQKQQQQTQMHKEEDEEEEEKEEEVKDLAVNDEFKKEESSTFKEEDGYLVFNTTNANGELIHCRVKIPSSTATSVRSSSPVMRRRPVDFPWALVSPPTTRAGSPRPPFEHNSTKKGLNPNAPEWNGNWKISPPHSTV